MVAVFAVGSLVGAAPVPAGPSGPPAPSGPVAPVAPVAPGQPAAVVAHAGATRPEAPLQVDDGDGILTQTSVLYAVDPGAGAIEVTVNLRLENVVRDRVDGPYLQQTYFSHFSVPVLTEATSFAAVDGQGDLLPVAEEGIDGDPWVGYATVDLQPDLYYGQQQSIQLTYQLPRQPARADGVSRVNDAFVSFPLFADGDPGLVSVEVRLPDRYEVEVVAGDLAREEQDGQIVLTASSIPDPSTFIPVVVASDEEHLVSRTVDLDGIGVEARAWPDDPQWADFVIQQLGAAIPVLTEMTGQPWPTTQTLEVTETAAPYAYGYAGWYSEVGHSISIGDALDPRVIVHEVSHVWFNSGLFTDRWVNEAFAEEYATTALDQLGQPQGAPPPPDRAGPGAIALNDWGNPSILDEDSEATEDYGYGTSWYVLDQIAAEVGVDRLRDVIAVAADGHISYQGDPEPEPGPRTTDWRRLLDLLEEVGGSQEAAGLFATYVVGGEQQALLEARAAARAEYLSLAERGGDWSPPLEVRELLAAWDFEPVADCVAEAGEVLELRARIDDVLQGTDVERLGLEDRYEEADDVGEVVALAGATLDAAEDYREVSERYDAGPGPVGAVGLWLSGVDDRLDHARTELERGDAQASQQASAAVEQRLDHATRDGLLRLGGLALLGGGAGLAAHRLRQRRRRLAIQVRVTSMPRPWPPPMPPPPRAPAMPPTGSHLPPPAPAPGPPPTGATPTRATPPGRRPVPEPRLMRPPPVASPVRPPPDASPPVGPPSQPPVASSDP